LARSTRDLLEIAERIKDAGAGLRSIAEPWADTTTPAGRMVLTVFAGIADFERSLIVERTSAGLRRHEAYVSGRTRRSGRSKLLTHANSSSRPVNPWPRLPDF
jgi:DNA invertase Pin-like site-specific DNA recombinase